MSWRAIKWARRQHVGAASAKAVLICLAHHADETGFCWPSQETMSTEIELSVDSVQRALKLHLEPRFVRRVKRKSSDGRRISDGYRLMLDYEFSGRQSRSCGSAPCGLDESSNQAADGITTKPQIGAPPNGILRPKSLEENNQEPSGRSLREVPGGKRLEKWLGKSVFDSWFATVVFLEERDQVLYFQSNRRHAAAYIEQQFDQKILDCFRPEYNAAVRVRVVVRASVDS